MATSNSSETLLQALSSFWLRMFADKDVLNTFFKGTEQLLGQAYLDILEKVLGTSLTLAPIYHKEYWKLITFRTDDVTFVPGTPNKYVIPLAEGVTDFKFLFNKVFSPTVTLEKDFDFTISSVGTGKQVVFSGTDPFSIAGVPSRKVDVVPKQKAKGSDGGVTSGSAVFTSASGQPTFTQYNVGDSLVLNSPSQSGTYKVTAVNFDGSLVLDKTFAATEIELGWTLLGPKTATQIAFWAPDVSIEKNVLADNFGYLVGQERPSSEAYRAFLRGVFQYFLLGPGLARVEAALNVAIGLPVVENDGEVVLVLTDSQVVTDRKIYDVPTGTVKGSLTLGQVLPAFSSLTNIFRVVDHVSDPTWWWNITIPQELLPDEGVGRRQVNPSIQPVQYQDGQTTVLYGDPGLYYGADDNGIVPPSPMVPYRHSFAYLVMDRMLKFNMFGIFVEPSRVPLDFGTSVIEGIIEAGKPAYTVLYAAPAPAVSDNMTVSDTVDVDVYAPVEDDLAASQNLPTYGSGMGYGAYFSYTPTGISIGYGSYNSSIGQTPVVYGGGDPFNVTEPGMTDWPVQITTTP